MSKNDSQIVISKKTLIIALIVLLLLIAGAVTVALNWNAWFDDSAPTGPSSFQKTPPPVPARILFGKNSFPLLTSGEKYYII